MLWKYVIWSSAILQKLLLGWLPIYRSLPWSFDEIPNTLENYLNDQIGLTFSEKRLKVAHIEPLLACSTQQDVFLATLVALHFTPVSKSVGES